jgi:hypothetical protein
MPALCLAEGKTIAELVGNSFPNDIEVEFWLNEKLIDKSLWDKFILNNNDVFQMVPKIGDPITGFIAAIGSLIQSLSPAAIAGAVTAGPGTGYGLVKGAITLGYYFAGGLALNYLTAGMMQAGDEPDTNYERSHGHSWEPATTQMQGSSIAEIFGRFKVYGNIVACRLEWATDRTRPAYSITGITQDNPAVVSAPVGAELASDQIVRVRDVLGMTQVNGRIFNVASAAGDSFELVGCNSTGYDAYIEGGVFEIVPMPTQVIYAIVNLGEGPIQGVMDSKIQKRPVSSLSEVGVELRYGLTDQSAPKWFQETSIMREVNLMASGSGQVASFVTIGRYFNKMIMHFSTPRGIHNGQGGYFSFDIKIDYRQYPYGDWVTLYDDAIKDREESAGGFDLDIPDLDLERRYEVRLQKVSGDTDRSVIGEDIFLSYVSEVLQTAFQYPQQSAVVVKALATDQISGNFDYEGVVDGKLIPVYKDVSDSIEGVSQAASAVITITGHSYIVGDYLLITGITTGMTEINNRFGRVTAADANTVTVNIDSSDFTAWSAGGTVYKFSIEWSANNAWVAYYILTRPLITGGGGGDINPDSLAADDLVCFCKMNDDDAGSIIDAEVGTGGTLKRLGNPLATNLISTAGYRGKALGLTGIDYINWTSSQWDVTGDLTLSIYIKPDHLCCPIFHNRFRMGSTTADRGWFFGTNDAGRLIFACGNNSDNNGEDNVVIGDTPVELSTWQLVTVVKSERLVTFYIDGIYAGGGTLASGTIAYRASYTERYLGNATVDRWTDSGEHGFGSRSYADMAVDELKFWDVALTWEQLQEKYDRDPYDIAEFRGCRPDRIDMVRFQELAEQCDQWLKTDTYWPITDITQADPGNVEIVGHELADGDKVIIVDAGGMTDINDKVYTVTVVDKDNVTIGIDTSGYDAWTSGGRLYKAERRYEYNDAIETDTNPLAAAQRVVRLARSAIIQKGVKYSVTISKTKTPTQMFTLADIVPGSFRGKFMGMADRASEFEAEFIDAEQDYNRTAIPKYDRDLLNQNNRVTLDMTGETSDSRVLRAIDFALKKNSIPIHSAWCDVYKTAMFTTLGECAYFQHDCPDFGSMGDNVQICGRVIAASSSSVKIVGRFKKNMAGGTTYDIMFVTKDNTILTREITLVTESGDISIVEFTPAITGDDRLTKDDIWAVGVQDVVAKQFDIAEIETGNDLYCSLKLVEYSDDIYELETAYEEAT